MSITLTSMLADTVPTIIDKAQMTRQFSAVMAALCWNKDKRNRAGSTVNIPYFSEVTAHVLTEGVDMTASESMADTNVPITLNEVGAKIILTDNAIEDDQEEIKSVAGKILGQAVTKKEDVDLLTQLDDGTNTVGATNTTLTMGHLAAAYALLSGNATSSGGPAPLPYVTVLHPFQILDIVDVVTPLVPAAGTMQMVGTAFTDDILKNYSIGRLFGMNIVLDGNIEIDATPDAKGGVFAAGENGGLVLVTARDMDVRPERDESLRGWELNCVSRYGVGEYMAGWIVTVHTDAATPT